MRPFDDNLNKFEEGEPRSDAGKKKIYTSPGEVKTGGKCRRDLYSGKVGR